jgi:Tol biopolymer transport system component
MVCSLCILLNQAVISQVHSIKQLTFSDSTHDGYPYWSPDGKYIIYCSGTRSSCYTLRIPSESGQPEKITESFAQHARWSPDGKYIAFDGYFGRLIQVVSSSGGESIRIDPDSIEIMNSGMPCWSPDGSMILFTSDHGGNADLWIMAINGGDPLQITSYAGEGSNPGYDIEASWSPDGTKIAFSSTRSGYWAIWLLEPDLDYIRTKLKMR